MPDNNIEWGQGGVNNSNDWGKAKANSTNNFGAVYDSSPSGDTNIAGGQPVVSITYSASAFCADASDPTPTVQNNAGAGTFSSTTGLVFISTTTGEVDIDASTVGSYLITYTDTDAATATFNLTINALPTVIVNTSAGTICDGESTILTASGASIYVWNDGNTDNPRTVSPTATTTFTATGTDSNGCSSSGGTTITVNAQDSAAFSYAASAYCANGTDPTPTITGTTGGAFTSTAGLNINASTGEIDLDASTVGTYSVTYTTTGVCPDNQSVNITINAADNAGFSYSASSYSQADTDPTPTITGLTGGTFSAGSGLVFVDSGTNTASSTGEIDLSASTIAGYTITYSTSSSGSSVCPNTSTFSLAVTAAYSPFQMQFSVTSGVSKTITIPATVGSSYTVDWGDGATTTESAGNITHTYNDGTYTDVTNPTVSIGAASDSGAFTFCSFNNNSAANDLIDIKKWGAIVWSDFLRVFKGCANLTNITATDAPDLSSCDRLTGAFYQASLSNVSTLNNWNVNTITNIGTTFFWGDFNANITSWDVSDITSMSSAFAGVGTGVNSVPFNQDISGWDVSSCINFDSTFQYATSFNQNLSDWTLNNSLTTMNRMFSFTNMSTENFTDTIVGWAVTIYNNSGLPSGGGMTNQKSRSFDGTRTSDAASGQTYSAKYGSNWTATGWTDAQDAFDYLTTTLSWTISF